MAARNDRQSPSSLADDWVGSVEFAAETRLARDKYKVLNAVAAAAAAAAA